MIPDPCSFCKGKVHEGKTEFLAHAAGEDIVIKNVPAYVSSSAVRRIIRWRFPGRLTKLGGQLTRRNCAYARFQPGKSHSIDNLS